MSLLLGLPDTEYEISYINFTNIPHLNQLQERDGKRTYSQIEILSKHVFIKIFET